MVSLRKQQTIWKWNGCLRINLGVIFLTPICLVSYTKMTSKYPPPFQSHLLPNYSPDSLLGFLSQSIAQEIEILMHAQRTLEAIQNFDLRNSGLSLWKCCDGLQHWKEICMVGGDGGGGFYLLFVCLNQFFPCIVEHVLVYKDGFTHPPFNSFMPYYNTTYQQVGPLLSSNYTFHTAHDAAILFPSHPLLCYQVSAIQH